MALACLAVCLPGAGAALAAGTSHITLRLDWTPLGVHAPFYYGVAKGIYAKAGFDVEVEPGNGSASTAELVGAGADDFGFADAATTARLIGQGLPDKLVMGILRRTTLALFFPEGRGIAKPSDLNGKRISMCSGDGISVYMPAYLASLGVKVQDVKLETVNCGVKYTVVAQGRADAVMSYATVGGPLLERVGIMHSGHFDAGPGFYLPAHGIVVSTKFIKAHPDVVRRFVQATAQAWLATERHQNAAIAAMIAANPLLKNQEPTLKQTLADSLQYVNTPETKGKPFGWQSPKDWKMALQLLKKNAGMNKDVAPDMVYTNAFVGS
ncbi:MAG: ABC transporter substrate-binding protein [Xanthobacteraceae bacterium]